MKEIVDSFDYKRSIVYPGRVIAQARSHVQEIVIAELDRFKGRSLWIGAEIDEWKLVPQFHEHDEHQYHQMLAFPPLAAIGNPGEGIILGGGDWPLAARVAMRKGVKHVLIADWDKRVGELVLEHIPSIRWFGVHHDARFDFSKEIDVTQYLPTAKSESVNYIFGDLTDVGDLKKIQPKFLQHCFRIVRPGGFVAFQAGAYGRTKDRVKAIREGIRDLRRAGFSAIWLWHEYIDSFGGQWLFMAGWKGVSPSREPVSERRFCQLFAMRRDRLHYSPEIHRRAFTLDPWVKGLLMT